MVLKNGAGDGARTRYLHLGKVALYQMSYARRTWCIITGNFISVKRKVLFLFPALHGKKRLTIPLLFPIIKIVRLKRNFQNWKSKNLLVQIKRKGRFAMIYSTEVQHMCPVAKGAYHGPAPIPEEGKWVQAKEIKDISGFTHGVGWCAPQQGACKLTLNVKEGVIEEALVETLGCSGMTHSAAMASEILIGKTILEALNTDLVCDAINTAMRELFLQIVYGRTQSAFSEDGLAVGASLEDLGKGLRSQVGTMFGTKEKGPRYLEMAEGYCTRMALNKDDEVIGYEFVNLGKMMDFIKKGDDANTALEKAKGHYGQFDDAVKYIDPRHE